MHLTNLIFQNMKDNNKLKLLEEKILLEELYKIIKEMNIEIYFSLNCSSEQNICLENIDGIWNVYFVERGKKIKIKEYEYLYDACKNVISRLSFTNESYYINKFERVLRR